MSWTGFHPKKAAADVNMPIHITSSSHNTPLPPLHTIVDFIKAGALYSIKLDGSNPNRAIVVFTQLQGMKKYIGYCNSITSGSDNGLILIGGALVTVGIAHNAAPFKHPEHLKTPVLNYGATRVLRLSRALSDTSAGLDPKEDILKSPEVGGVLRITKFVPVDQKYELVKIEFDGIETCFKVKNKLEGLWKGQGWLVTFGKDPCGEIENESSRTNVAAPAPEAPPRPFFDGHPEAERMRPAHFKERMTATEFKDRLEGLKPCRTDVAAKTEAAQPMAETDEDLIDFGEDDGIAADEEKMGGDVDEVDGSDLEEHKTEEQIMVEEKADIKENTKDAAESDVKDEPEMNEVEVEEDSKVKEVTEGIAKLETITDASSTPTAAPSTTAAPTPPASTPSIAPATAPVPTEPKPKKKMGGLMSSKWAK